MENLKLTTSAEKELANKVLDAFAKHYTGYGTEFSKYLNDFKECYNLNQTKLDTVYKDGSCIVFVQSLNKKKEAFTGYGINDGGNWFVFTDWDIDEDWQEATPQEWLDVLKKEAKKRGYYDNPHTSKGGIRPKVTDLQFNYNCAGGHQNLSDTATKNVIWNSIDGWAIVVEPSELENKVEKPPLGLKPLFIHNEHRLNKIMEAIKNYSNANKSIPKEWVNELENLQLTMLQTKK